MTTTQPNCASVEIMFVDDKFHCLAQLLHEAAGRRQHARQSLGSNGKIIGIAGVGSFRKMSLQNLSLIHSAGSGKKTSRPASHWPKDAQPDFSVPQKVAIRRKVRLLGNQVR